MVAINGVNGVSPKPITMTLDELLKDGKFDVIDSPISSTNYNEDQLYQICLGSFIRGDAKDCLEKMYESGFLNAQTLTENERIYALFQGACDAIKNFNELGISLQGVVRKTFTGDTNHLKNHVDGEPKSFKIAIMNRYFKCCAKVLQMDSITNGPEVNYLETKLRKEISNHCNTPLFQDPESIVELEQLVETYIFYVQVELMHKQVSTYLYKRLSSFAPGLSDNLNRVNESGKTVEQKILEKLETKQCRSKKSSRRPSSSQRQKDTTVTEKILPASVSQQDQTPEISQEQQQQQLQITPRWLHICYKYITRFEFSRQTLFVVLLLLLLSARKFKNISRIPQYITQTARATVPHLRNVLRLLSSI